jgi:hypothetical protein
MRALAPNQVHLASSHLFNLFGKRKAAKRRITLTASARGVSERRMPIPVDALFVANGLDRIKSGGAACG